MKRARPVLLLGLLWCPAVAGFDQAVFRARTDLVAISASVKRGNAPVANLTAADFRLTDNGVPQTVDAVTIESVPLDVTLFMDTSGSTAGALDRMKKNVSTMAGMLRPDDQFRLMTIGLTVEVPVPWQPAGRPIVLDMKAVPGISLMNSVGAWCTPSDLRDTDFLGNSAARTGGESHRSRFGDPAVRSFARILDEFRQSYVLRYSPQGVAAPGWHAVTVQVPAQPALTIKARSGYYGTLDREP